MMYTPNPQKDGHHTYDDKGRLIEKITCDKIGCFDKTVSIYDSRGNLTEETLFYPSDESFKVRVVHAYDREHHSIRSTSQGAHGPGLGIGDTIQKYDPMER